MSDETIIRYGDSLLTTILQTGWTVEQDGFGLIQVEARYKLDRSLMNEFTTLFVRGSTSAPSPFQYCKMWKASVTEEKTNTLTITASFCGIDPNFGGSSYTQVAMTGSSASEPIEKHPNFLKVNCTSITTEENRKLAGYPPIGGWEENPTLNPNRALWTPGVGNSGATQGYQFVGFLPGQKSTDPINIKAGIKAYYKPQITLRCLLYIADPDVALSIASYNGWITNGDIVGLPAEYKALALSTGYPGIFKYTSEYEAKIKRTFLMTNVSCELYGSIYKVTADLMLSGISGWDPDVYPVIT
jgi:hypothetical protein